MRVRFARPAYGTAHGCGAAGLARQPVASVLKDWLGVDFPNDRRGERVRAVLRGLTQESRAFRHQGELLPNPLALFDMPNGPCADNLPCLRGSVHGDLHLRNIMVRGSLLTRNLAYWLIDVNWSSQAPLLYDHAYLELAALLDGLRRSGSGFRVLPLMPASTRNS